MKIRVTVSGIMTLEAKDVQLLKAAVPEAVMDTLKFQAARLETRVEALDVKKKKPAPPPEKPEGGGEQE